MIENFLILKKQPFSYTFSDSFGVDISSWSCSVKLYYNNELRYTFDSVTLTAEGYITIAMSEVDVNGLNYSNYVYKAILDDGAGKQYIPYWGHAFVEKVD